MNKKATMKKGEVETSSAAASLIGILILLFLGYIILIPPEYRQELLGPTLNTSTGTTGTTITSITKLAKEAPGRLEYTARSEEPHYLTSVFIDARKNAQTITTFWPIEASKTLFSVNKRTLMFALPPEAENAALTFQATERKGTLIISLNGIEIVRTRVQTQTPPPIMLPKDLLSEKNVLEVSTEGSIFETKKYLLTDAKIVADVPDKTKSSAQVSLSIGETEYEQMETTRLNYYTRCLQEEVGKIYITLNGRQVASDTPVCGTPSSQDLYKEDFQKGKNTITFSLDKGAISLDQIEAVSSLSPTKPHVTYFYVKQELMDDVQHDKANVVLKIEFIDDGSTKMADLIVNGIRFAINQKEAGYSRGLDSWIRPGNNYIQIIPRTTLDIANLEIRAEQ